MNIKQAWKALWAQNPTTTYGTARVVNGQVTWIDDNYTAYVTEGYSTNDIVYSIITITSEKIRVAPWNVYKVKDESSLKQLFAEENKPFAKKNFRKISDLKVKALELYDADGKLNELVQWPNEQEAFSDLVANSSINKMITGNRYIQGVLLDIGNNKGKPQELHLLAPGLVSIVNTGTHPMRVVGYRLMFGKDIPITKEEVLHDRYFNPNVNYTGSHLYGLAPLKAALQTLTVDNSSNYAATRSFQNMGPGQIAYLDDQRLEGDTPQEQMNALKKKWDQDYTGMDAVNKTAWSGYKVGVAQMGLSPTDLKIIEQQKWNLNKFCNVWNFPHQLVNPEQSTFNNLQEAEKALTGRCALPLMTSFRNNFNRKLQTDWGYKGKNIWIDFDQTVYPEMQDDQKEIADWLSKSWHIPLKMKYELQGLDIPEYIDSKLLEKIFVPNNMTELSSLLDNTQALMDQMNNQDNQPNPNETGNTADSGGKGTVDQTS